MEIIEIEKVTGRYGEKFVISVPDKENWKTLFPIFENGLGPKSAEVHLNKDKTAFNEPLNLSQLEAVRDEIYREIGRLTIEPRMMGDYTEIDVNRQILLGEAAASILNILNPEIIEQVEIE